MGSAHGFAKEQCLVAMPCLENSYFEKSVIYLLDHNENGAFGLVINKPMDIAVDEILRQINEDYHSHFHPEPAYAGGPVDGHRGFVLHQPMASGIWQQQATVNHHLAITSSADILHAMSKNENVQEYMIVLGYSGWSAGQLEQEIADNSWLTINIPIADLLRIPAEQRLDAALQTLGIKYAQLGKTAGHA